MVDCYEGWMFRLLAEVLAGYKHNALEISLDMGFEANTVMAQVRSCPASVEYALCRFVPRYVFPDGACSGQNCAC